MSTQYVEIPLTEERAQHILQTEFTKEEADLLCFLAQAYKNAVTDLDVQIGEFLNERLQ